VEVAARSGGGPPLFRMMAGLAAFLGDPDLHGNARGGAGRVDQEGEGENEGHAPFYSGRRVTMAS
jgi:hypothetical protein